jgi:lysozyme family protein
MPTFEVTRASYRKLWDGMVINADKVQAADIAAKRIISGMARYKAVERRTSVPWFFVGLCHMREGNFNFGTYLGNGQSINRVTTIVPIARGPFESFEDGAVDALKFQGLINITDWSLERIAFCLEGFNGFGYRGKGVNTPYLWAGTNRYTSGKYVADHVFDPAAVDKQLGSMAVLSRLCALSAEVNSRVNGVAFKQPPPPDVPAPIKPPAKPKSNAGPAGTVIVAGGAAGAAAHSHGLSTTSIVIAVAVVIALVIGGVVLWRKIKRA